MHLIAICSLPRTVNIRGQNEPAELVRGFRPCLGDVAERSLASAVIHTVGLPYVTGPTAGSHLDRDPFRQSVALPD